MNLMQLKYFNKICECKSVSDAALFLHISQPSLSNAVKELETEFKVKLFSRHYRGVELTKEGMVLYNLSKDLLMKADEISHIMKDFGVERKILRLGVPPMIASMFLPDIYREFLPLNSEIKLEITECGQKELISKLEDETLDMVFLPHSKALGNDFSYIKVNQLETVCCVSGKNELSKLKKVTPEDLTDTKLVLFNNSFLQTEEINKWFAVKNIKPHIILQTEQLSTVQSLVLNNIGAGFMFRHLAEENSKIVSIPVENPFLIDVSLVWRKNAYFFSATSKFKNYIENYKMLFE